MASSDVQYIGKCKLQLHFTFFDVKLPAMMLGCCVCGCKGIASWL